MIARVAELARATGGRTAWVGIDGCGAAGKSTLAAAIAAEVTGVSVVAVDDFNSPLILEWDWERFRTQVLLPLSAGRAARYQIWNWDQNVGGDWVDIAPGGLVVVEGVSSTRTEAAVPWDLTIWVEAPRDLRLVRAIERDGESMRAVWEEIWMPSEEAYIAREDPRSRSDLVVSGEA